MAMVKLILQLADNAGAKGFKRAMAFEILEQSLPAGLNKSQKLNFLTHLLMGINERGFIIKSESGKSWIISDAGKKYLNS